MVPEDIKTLSKQAYAFSRGGQAQTSVKAEPSVVRYTGVLHAKPPLPPTVEGTISFAIYGMR